MSYRFVVKDISTFFIKTACNMKLNDMYRSESLRYFAILSC